MMKESADIKKLGEMIKGIKIAMLTTVDAEGELHSRPMATQKVEFDGDLWFFTRGKGGKVEEIDHDSHVNLAYAKPDDNNYVSVTGIGRVVHDDTKMQELWDASYSEYFPGGLSDPDLALLKVEVASAEYWSTGGGAQAVTKGGGKPAFNRGVMTGRATAPEAEPGVRPVTAVKGETRGDHGRMEFGEHTRH